MRPMLEPSLLRRRQYRIHQEGGGCREQGSGSHHHHAIYVGLVARKSIRARMNAKLAANSATASRLLGAGRLQLSADLVGDEVGQRRIDVRYRGDGIVVGWR